MNTRKCKGISEILSAIILIVAVLASMVIYTSLSKERIFANTLSVNDALKRSEEKTSELLTKVIVSTNDTNSTAYLINYGLKNITIANVFVDDNTTAQQFLTCLISDKTCSNPLGKNGNYVTPVLPDNQTVMLFVNSTANERIVMVSESGRIYELDIP
jgi:hypothetical protein